MGENEAVSRVETEQGLKQTYLSIGEDIGENCVMSYEF